MRPVPPTAFGFGAVVCFVFFLEAEPVRAQRGPEALIKIRLQSSAPKTRRLRTAKKRNATQRALLHLTRIVSPQQELVTMHERTYQFEMKIIDHGRNRHEL